MSTESTIYIETKDGNRSWMMVGHVTNVVIDSNTLYEDIGSSYTFDTFTMPIKRTLELKADINPNSYTIYTGKYELPKKKNTTTYNRRLG